MGDRCFERLPGLLKMLAEEICLDSRAVGEKFGNVDPL